MVTRRLLAPPCKPGFRTERQNEDGEGKHQKKSSKKNEKKNGRSPRSEKGKNGKEGLLTKERTDKTCDVERGTQKGGAGSPTGEKNLGKKKKKRETKEEPRRDEVKKKTLGETEIKTDSKNIRTKVGGGEKKVRTKKKKKKERQGGENSSSEKRVTRGRNASRGTWPREVEKNDPDEKKKKKIKIEKGGGNKRLQESWVRLRTKTVANPRGGANGQEQAFKKKGVRRKIINGE